MKLEDYERIKQGGKYHPPVYNPIKANLKRGFNFIKLFWAVILLGLILLLLKLYGNKLGIRF